MDVSYLVLSVLAFFCTRSSTQPCIPTFQNHHATVEYGNQRITGVITGCLFGNQLPNINGNHFVINIKGQVIPALHRSAVSHIQRSFRLNIIHNKIEAIERGAFENLPGLQDLYLDHNHLVTVKPYAFENLPSLEWISLQNNNIDVIWKDTFVNLPRLNSVYLSHNNLKKFNQDWFVSTPVLDRIVLINNQIESLPAAAFQNLRSITVLAIDDNKLKYIHPEAFHGLSRLDELSLGGNQLTAFDVNLSHLRALYRLGIERNKFTYLPTSAFSQILPTVQEIFVQANPLVCSCADALVVWASDNNIKLFWKCENKDMYCVLPLDYANDCVKRPASDFNSTLFKNFESECVIQ
ncbi:connectin-like [Photinus pyralis]|uniref:LRRCT domain-containing protein n=1 Tax=Photinus pyralis TaxID=7054 RepID=A0A1Y1KPU9_PHOPY|nr:connectin-like [Photinus pyralis]